MLAILNEFGLRNQHMAKWITAQVNAIHWWNERLFTLKIEADIPPFKAGQFTKLAMEVDGKRVARAYSFVNAPDEPTLEFYLIKVDDGTLSLPLAALKVGDTVDIAAQATGFFTIDEVPKSPHLWLLSTGTAIGPFLSMLHDDKTWQTFKRITLVQGVRYQNDLAYLATIDDLCQRYPQFDFISVVSRERNEHGLSGRIPTLISEGLLQQHLDTSLKADHQFMICGNPDMVKDTTAALEALGYTRNRRSAPGHITVEQYW